MDRNEEIKDLRNKGLTLQRIADKFSLSRERIRQIILAKPRPNKIHIIMLCIVCAVPVECTKKIKYPCCDSCRKVHFTHKSGYPLQGMDFPRQLVRLRDKETCQKCGKIWKDGERRFDVHHLNGECGKNSRGYDSVKNMRNLITVCHKCHLNIPEVRYKIKHALSPRPKKHKDYFVKNYEKIQKKQKEWRARTKSNPQVSSN